MFVDMLLRTFPRTWQAVVALVIMLAALREAFTGLQALIVPDMHLGVWGSFKLVSSLLVGIAATIAFYYYQGLAESKSAGVTHPLETLSKSQESQHRYEALHNSATPVFSSHQGEIKPPSIDKTSE